MNHRKVWIYFVATSLWFLMILSLRLHGQQQQPASNSLDLPKPVLAPTVGTWKYKQTMVDPNFTRDGKAVSNHSPITSYLTMTWTYSITTRDDGDVWTVTTAWKSRAITDVSTLAKGTLILRREFKQFPGSRKLVAMNLDFTGNRVTGAMKYGKGQDKIIALDLRGPVFGTYAYEIIVGCLPLEEGYSTAFRYFNIESLESNPQETDQEGLHQLRVVGIERVTVPAGTFDSYKVELTEPNSSFKRIIWIAKDLRMPVKENFIQRFTIVGDTVLVP